MISPKISHEEDNPGLSACNFEWSSALEEPLK